MIVDRQEASNGSPITEIFTGLGLRYSHCIGLGEGRSCDSPHERKREKREETDIGIGQLILLKRLLRLIPLLIHYRNNHIGRTLSDATEILHLWKFLFNQGGYCRRHRCVEASLWVVAYDSV